MKPPARNPHGRKAVCARRGRDAVSSRNRIGHCRRRGASQAVQLACFLFLGCVRLRIQIDFYGFDSERIA